MYEKPIRNRFRLEGGPLQPIARIYTADGQRTSAFIAIDCQRPDPGVIPKEIVREAVKRYEADLDRPF